jgi:SAM-dependent methyltransferase
MSLDDLNRWNAKYSAMAPPVELKPDAWLREAIASESPGRALELASGLGHNAIWLARQGWRVDAVDVSTVGLRHAQSFMQNLGLRVNWIEADLDEFVPESGVYDLALVFRFLDRRRLPALLETALRPGGRLVYETFTMSHTRRVDSRMKNPDFALQSDELLQLFPNCDPVSYQECSLTDRDVARLVARRKGSP